VTTLGPEGPSFGPHAGTIRFILTGAMTSFCRLLK
jgi:hypothetical protein